jgi:hypothetical protein
MELVSAEGEVFVSHPNGSRAAEIARDKIPVRRMGPLLFLDANMVLSATLGLIGIGIARAPK